MTMTLDPHQFDVEVLKSNGITACFGVPDSSPNGLLRCFHATKPPPEHVLMANEGGAVALAAGYHLATGRIALVYMQNSGFANALNPLQSLAAKEVFGIPMLLLIGWRGRPGETDEPQHANVGPRLLRYLAASGLPHEELQPSIPAARDMVGRLVAQAVRESTPVAVIVPKSTFAAYEGEVRPVLPRLPPRGHAPLERWTSSGSALPMSREMAIRSILRHVQAADCTVSSLGGNSRELYMTSKEGAARLDRNFFCLGAMGHTFALATGIAMGRASGRVICIDGDGSFLMHMGNNAVLADVVPRNVIHVVIYNGVHSSTGNQPLMIHRNSVLALAEGLPYSRKFVVDGPDGLARACERARPNTLIIVLVNEAVRADLPRPSESAQELKRMFLSHTVRSHL